MQSFLTNLESKPRQVQFENSIFFHFVRPFRTLEFRTNRSNAMHRHRLTNKLSPRGPTSKAIYIYVHALTELYIQIYTRSINQA